MTDAQHFWMVEISVTSPEYREAVVLRNRVLREPLGLAITEEELAEDWRAFHLACFLGARLVGCLLLTPHDTREIKMRQVAVAPDLQRQGIGKRLVHYCEEFCAARGFREIVLHAREGAVNFYERLGYERRGEQFVEVTIPHWFMRKELAGQS